MSEQTNTTPQLRLVSSNVDASTSVSDRQALYTLLKAKLPSGKTVEEACHLAVFDGDCDEPDTAEFMADYRELREAGLRGSIPNDDYDYAVVLDSASKFKKAFPHLAHICDLLERSGGVIPYTGGAPRKITGVEPSTAWKPKIIK
ncbi:MULTISPECIES: hypothetical protein [Burkholderia cepacia complex]|uniref:hypothetical protein n=1 Tax=Burkholderia cepacia complex TaxID=87882 RepID=UPI000A79C487|nr:MULTISPECIES: hypothetical protein [Burkholderia cepacia complex]